MILDFFGNGIPARSGGERTQKKAAVPAASSFSDDYRAYGYDYFDNPDLGVGYGSYCYDERYAPSAAAMCAHYGLSAGSTVLEIGCAKGFLLAEFQKLGLVVRGVDMSRYAVENAFPSVRGGLTVGSAAELPFPDRSFDLVVGKEVLPHLPEGVLERALEECMRVAKGTLFFEIQCGRTPEEQAQVMEWDCTHQTVRSPFWWETLLATVNYTGDVHYKVLFPEAESARETN